MKWKHIEEGHVTIKIFLTELCTFLELKLKLIAAVAKGCHPHVMLIFKVQLCFVPLFPVFMNYDFVQ